LKIFKFPSGLQAGHRKVDGSWKCSVILGKLF